MASFTFKMNDDQIEAGIKSIKSRVASVRVDIHKIMVSITRNWAASGAVNVARDRMSQLLDAVDPAHKQKLVNWCNVHCSFELEQDEDGNDVFVYDANRTKMTEQEWAEAKAQTMFDLTPDPKPVPFNLEQSLRKLLERARNRPSSKKASEDDVIDMDLLKAAEALLPSEE